jgi:subtilase family serine protease
MQRTIGAALAAGLLLTSIAPAGAMVTTRGSAFAGRHRADLVGWAATATQAMTPINAVDMGPVSAALPMKIVVGLKANTAAAEALAKHVYAKGDPLYHQFITPQQYLQSFAPSSASANAVASYLAAQGFTGVKISENNMTVRAVGTAAIVQNAFATKLESYVQGGKAIYVNTAPASLPSALSSLVVSVLGLQNVPMQLALPTAKERALARMMIRRNVAMHRQGAKKSNRRFATTSSDVCEFSIPDVPCVPSSFYSNDLRKFYDAQPGDTGEYTKEAVFTEGDVSDIVPGLQQNQAQNGLPSFPVVVKAIDLQSSDTYGQGEFTMDTQMSTGLAYKVKKLVLYNTGSLNDSDTTLSFNKWASEGTAEVANASFGECEYEAELDGAMPLDDQIFQEALLQGQTLFASAGDSGSSCGFNAVTNGLGPIGPTMVSYPASSPYVMGAGGTTALPNTDGSYFGEIPWYSGGGGVSLFEPPEFWTYQAVAFQCIPVYCSIAGPGLPVAVTGGTSRAVPDVAMDADAEDSGANYFLNGSQTENGGTSLSSPLSVGAYAILQSEYGETLGHAGPAYYGNYLANGGGTAKLNPPAAGAITVPIGGFNDILVGGNGLYTALPGYDLTTGMGSVDVHSMVTHFAN